MEPLFPAREPGLGIAAQGEWEWYVARPTQSIKGAHAWEAAYDSLRTAAGIAGGAPAYVEPDLVQEWPYENPLMRGEVAPAAGEVCVFNDQNNELPRVPGRFAWHLDDSFSQLRAARVAAGPVPGSGRVRIVHLDTGYDPQHATFPGHVSLQLQRNFVEGENANDARDPGDRGLLKNPGHGTGTLSILAGNVFAFAGQGYNFNEALGGAPEAEIVPVRVGNSVVQLATSSVARGIEYAAALCANAQTRVHVISMSMGGVASAAWADAVNRAYDAGIVFVAAAGNNFSAGFFGFPTRFIVYPARFHRVIAACGVMANQRPYFGLAPGTMQGNFGPGSKMATAMSAYTPNISWAELQCANIVDMEGQGTSSATPQVAAAAALYMHRHADALAQYPEAWMRVEAVRHALFTSADKSADGGSPERLGHGILQAARALAVQPLPQALLKRTPKDSAIFSFLRVLTGLGAAASEADSMLELEATQLAQSWGRKDVPNPLESAMADPDLADECLSPAQVQKYLEALLEHPGASKQLKARVEQVRTAVFGAKPKRAKAKAGGAKQPPHPPPPAAAAAAGGEPPPPPFKPPKPPFRTLRGFAIDPSLATQLETAGISEMLFKVPWEDLPPGPVGEYLEVIDVDPGSGCFYEPVNLDHPHLLAQDGLSPSESNPQFHQQMVYAVSSLTIRNFERALGRRALWRNGPSPDPDNEKNDSVYVPRLRIHPHALREKNAYYTPQKIALLFGYFNATTDQPGEHLPGGMVFTCLSHDIVAHETTHALLDGMYRRFLSPSNPDVRAFHEAFADIVALFQHFTFPEILRHQIRSTRGEIRSQQNLLGQLAGQFGRTTGMRSALRDGIGKVGEDGVWKPHQPNPAEYENEMRPHQRGSILVAAIFDAFLSIYERRIADLLRLATGGTGILQPGAIHPDLVDRLAAEAAKSAQHVLTMCIRALDYCPPTDITFGEYLRALITADCDMVRDDDLNYRVAFIEAFRKRGIYPRDVRTLSLESLLWAGPHNGAAQPSRRLESCLDLLREDAKDSLYARTREEEFCQQRAMRIKLHDWLQRHFASGEEGRHDAGFLGLNPDLRFEVHTARFANRIGPDGDLEQQVLITLLQERQEPVSQDDPSGEQMTFEGGSTIVADLSRRQFRYCVYKNLNSATRLERQQGFALASRDSLRATYLSGADALEKEPLAALHRGR